MLHCGTRIAKSMASETGTHNAFHCVSGLY